MRITLNDNLLKRVLPRDSGGDGHEMGHYVMNHIPKSVLFSRGACDLLRLPALGADLDAGPRGARWGFMRSPIRRVCCRWSSLAASSSSCSPRSITLEIRSQEKEPDMFGLNAARQPDGFAQPPLPGPSTARCAQAAGKILS